MGISDSDFKTAQSKSVDGSLPVGGWQVYPTYKLWWYEEEHEGEEVQRFPHFQASRVPLAGHPVPEGTEEHQAGYREYLVPNWSTVEVYAPLQIDDLFVQFASLFDGQRVAFPLVPETLGRIRRWIEGYGVLGRFGTYPTPGGGMVTGRHNDREDAMMFVKRAVEANRMIRLFSAATEPDGPNAEKLRALDVKGDSPEQMKKRAIEEVVDAVDKHLESETFTRLYRSRDGGELFRGPGFYSLLGALWLQMSNLLTAPQENTWRCRWCGDIITAGVGEPLAGDAPRGARGKHKTHKNRKFCKRKRDVEGWCKNQWHDDLRKKLSAAAASDASSGMHMREDRPGEWAELPKSRQKVYDRAYRAATLSATATTPSA